jgi:hypothetical protein
MNCTSKDTRAFRITNLVKPLGICRKNFLGIWAITCKNLGMTDEGELELAVNMAYMAWKISNVRYC